MKKILFTVLIFSCLFATAQRKFIVTVGGGSDSLNISTGLTKITGTVTANLSTGVAGGEAVIGGIASGNGLTLSSTSHATKGKIFIGSTGYDEANNRLGVGIWSPTAALHIKAGTSTASTAPLKFTSGTVLTTPENGAVEFDGTHYYGTVGSTRCQLDQQTTGSADPLAFVNGYTANDSTLRLKRRDTTGVKFVFQTEPSDASLDLYELLGSKIVAQPTGLTLGNLTTNNSLATGVGRFVMVKLRRAKTLAGIAFKQSTLGIYTAGAYNGIALCSVNLSTGQLTIVASSTDDGNIWQNATGLQKKAFSTPCAAAAGVYVCVALYTNSAQTTAPGLGSGGAFPINTTTAGDFSNSMKIRGTVSSLTALTVATTFASSSVSTTTANYYLAPYSN